MKPWENIVFRNRRTPISQEMILLLVSSFQTTLVVLLTMRLMGFQYWHSKSRETSFYNQGQQNSGSGQLSRSLSNPHHNLRSTSSDRENQDPTEK
ncbi:7795_t:CDS:2, partial [Rhizophagus irregularis]